LFPWGRAGVLEVLLGGLILGGMYGLVALGLNPSTASPAS
jgi:hypothetical protein